MKFDVNTTWMRPLLVFALFGVWGCPPTEEQPDDPVADMSEDTDQGPDGQDMADMGEDDLGGDMPPDSEDMSPDDMERPEVFVGIRSVTPALHDASAPTEATLELDLQGELPEDAEILLEVDGEQVDLSDELRFTPPARPGAPGPRAISVTIDQTTHKLEDALRYAVDIEGNLDISFDPTSSHRAFPGVERVVGAWNITAADGQIDWFLLDRPSGEQDPTASSSRLVHVREDAMGMLTVIGKAELPPGAELVRHPMIRDADGDGQPDAFTALAVSPGAQGKGASLHVARLRDDNLSDFETEVTLAETDHLLDAVAVEFEDPDTGASLLQVVSVLVTGSQDERHVAFQTTFPAVETSELGLPEYEPELLESGREQIRLMLDESAPGNTPRGFVVGVDVDTSTGISEILYAPATSHNASRSNRSSGIMMPDGGGDCDDGDPIVLPGFDARITDYNGDGVGDLIVGAGCPGESTVFLAEGAVFGEGADAVRDFSNPLALMQNQTSSGGVHSMRVSDGTLLGLAAPVCDASLCSLPSLYAIPGDKIGDGGGEIVPVLAAAPATSHNASRSNRSQGVAFPGGGSGDGDIDAGELQHRLLPGRAAIGATSTPPLSSSDGVNYWLPAGDGLTRTFETPSSSLEEMTSLEQLRDVLAYDSVMTEGGRLILASIRGPVSMRTREEVARDGGALLEQGAPRVIAARCVNAEVGQAVWSDETCPGGFEVTELMPPEECFWDGHVSLYRASDAAAEAPYAEALVGIRPEENHKGKLYRFYDDKPVNEVESRPGKHFPAANSFVWGEGRHVFALGEDGEVLAGEVSVADDAEKQVELTSTKLLETIRATEGEGASITRTFSICLEDRGHVLAANARDEQGRGHIYFWVPGEDGGAVSKAAGDDHIGNFNFVVEISGIARQISTDEKGDNLLCGQTDHFLIAGTGDEGFAILDAVLSIEDDGSLKIHTDPVFEEGAQQTESPLYEGAIPDDHSCKGEASCPRLIDEVGDFDGDGVIDLILPGKEGPVLYAGNQEGAPKRVGPIRWMAPEQLRASSSSASAGGDAQAMRRADGSVVVLPPLVVYWNGAAIPSVP